MTHTHPPAPSQTGTPSQTPPRSSNYSAPLVGSICSGSCPTTRSTSPPWSTPSEAPKRGSASILPSCAWPAGSRDDETDDASSTTWSTPTSSPWSTRWSTTSSTNEPHEHPYRADLRPGWGRQEKSQFSDRPAGRLRRGAEGSLRKATCSSADAPASSPTDSPYQPFQPRTHRSRTRLRPTDTSSSRRRSNAPIRSRAESHSHNPATPATAAARGSERVSHQVASTTRTATDATVITTGYNRIQPDTPIQAESPAVEPAPTTAAPHQRQRPTPTPPAQGP